MLVARLRGALMPQVARGAEAVPILLAAVFLTVLLSFLATLAAAVMGYGTHPAWVQYEWGVGLITLSRRLQWPLIALSLILCLTLLALVIAGKRRAWWLIALLPVLALFGHRFVTGPANRYAVLDEPAMIAAGEATHLSADDYVVGLVFNDQPYAYPYQTLFSHPVVVQSDREKRLLLAWSPFANAATAFQVSRDVKGRDLEIVSDPANSLLIYHGRRGAFLCALTGLSPRGQKVTGMQDPVPIVKLPWPQWLAEHPDTKVLAPHRGKPGPGAPILPREPAGGAPPGFQRRVALIGVSAPVAVPMDDVGAVPINLHADGVPVVLFRDKSGGRMRAFDRHVDADLTPHFSLNRDSRRRGAFMIDADTNTGWSEAGVAVEGDQAWRGKKLASIPVQEDVYWGPARFWYPQLKLHVPEEPPRASRR